MSETAKLAALAVGSFFFVAVALGLLLYLYEERRAKRRR